MYNMKKVGDKYVENVIYRFTGKKIKQKQMD